MGILQDVKHIAGIPAEYDVFDLDVMLHANTAFADLNQLGIGPDDGFQIEDDSAEWVDFYGTDLRYRGVKTYVCLRVRLLFDPPSTSYHLAAMKEQIRELEYRLNTIRETGDLPYVTTIVQDELAAAAVDNEDD